jgi:nicotinate-nucleotide adenylyltransferase
MCREKILFFGGSFNPIHNGHTKLVKKVAKRLNIEKIVLIPTGKSGYKETDDFASSQDRLNMCRLATEDSNIEISTVETDVAEQSYTYSTLKKLHKIYEDFDFYFMMGSDMFLTFHSWRNPTEVLAQTSLVIIPRDSSEIDDLENYAIDKFKDYLEKIIFVDVEKIDISSTKIREDIRNGKNPKGLNKKVLDYIKENNLYNMRGDA